MRVDRVLGRRFSQLDDTLQNTPSVRRVVIKIRVMLLGIGPTFDLHSKDIRGQLVGPKLIMLLAATRGLVLTRLEHSLVPSQSEAHRHL